MPTRKYANLPSGSAISYSEVDTFLTCKRQHFWRYYMRLASKTYLDVRHMVMGEILHQVVEAVYLYPDIAIQDLIDDVIAKVREEFADESFAPFMSIGQFETDLLVADQLSSVWYHHIYLTEQIRMVEPEKPFDIEIAGQRFVGFIDGIYDVDHPAKPGIYIGESKSRGASFNKKLQSVVRGDLQTGIYWTAASLMGLNPQGVVYTVVKKPPASLMIPMNGSKDENEAIRQNILEYYAEPVAGTHFMREIVPIQIDIKKLEKKITSSLSTMNRFYSDPMANLKKTSILHPNYFPCSYCEFSRICHGGSTIDGSFRYKKKRPEVGMI